MTRGQVGIARSWTHLCAGALLITHLTTGPINARESADDPTRLLPPATVWFSISGLDSDHNELDAILATFGHLCIHDKYQIFKPGRCPVELEFTDFLKRLPPEQPEIARKLRSLGAVCREAKVILTCTYKKHSNFKTYKGTVLWDDMDDFYHVEFIVTKRDSTLEYLTNVERRSKWIPVR
jgi:hypothetical protein